MIVISEVSSQSSRKGLDPVGWLVLIAAALLLAADIGFTIYGLRLPTDGWSIDRGAFGRYETILFLEPRPGVSSGLAPGDRLLSVEGIPFNVLEARAAVLDPIELENWQVGATVSYTVDRGGERINVDVELVPNALLSSYSFNEFKNFPVLLSFPLFCLIGLAVFILRPGERAAQLLFLYSFGFYLDNLTTWFAVNPGLVDLLYRRLYWPRIILGNLSWIYLLLPVMLHLLLVFPVVKGPLKRNPRLIPGLIYSQGAVASTIFFVLSVRGVDISGTGFATLQTVPIMLLCTISLAHSAVTIREPVPRLQARWVVFGSLVGLVGPVMFWSAVGGLTSSLPLWQSLVFLLLVLVLPVSLAIAILRYRLWDIEVIIRRTLVYSLLSGTLAAIYFGSILMLQTAASALTGERSEFAIVVSTLSVAALFQPLRRRIQRFIDRSFYRRKYDAERTLAGLANILRDEVDPDRLAAAVLRVLHRTVSPEKIILHLRDGRAAPPPGSPGRRSA